MQPEAPYMQLATLSRMYVLSRAIYTVAKLGIANHMSTKLIDIPTLSQKTGTIPELLHRLLHFLSSYGIFHHEGNAYALTALSAPLRDDDPHSMRDVLCMVDETWWQAFAYMDATLTNGKPAFAQLHGEDFFSYLKQHPSQQSNFDRGMAKLSSYDDAAIANAVDFDKFKHVMDLGGGRGGLIKAIAAQYTELTLTLFETDAVISELKASAFPPQVRLVKGNFLESIPTADAYFFKGVLHDFNDELMQQILRNCYQSMTDDARLLIAEQVLPENNLPHPNKTMDVVMMVLLGGRQRSLADWQSFLAQCGFAYIQSYPTQSLFTVMMFKRAGANNGHI